MMKRTGRAAAVLGAAGLCFTLVSGVGWAKDPVVQPRLLGLPWLVIDRTTNRECSRCETSGAPVNDEARRLAQSAQAALDGGMHRHRMMQMIPRREWEPHWKALAAGQVFRQGPGCSVCTPVGELIRYDRPALQGLAQAASADYVWLGVTVLPLTRETVGSQPDDCCREALGTGRKAVLARSSVLLVRASDGEVVWQRDARRLEGDVPHRVGKSVRPPSVRRAYAVDATARLLSNAFRREHREALQ